MREKLNEETITALRSAYAGQGAVRDLLDHYHGKRKVRDRIRLATAYSFVRFGRSNITRAFDTLVGAGVANRFLDPRGGGIYFLYNAAHLGRVARGVSPNAAPTKSGRRLRAFEKATERAQPQQIAEPAAPVGKVRDRADQIKDAVSAYAEAARQATAAREKTIDALVALTQQLTKAVLALTEKVQTSDTKNATSNGVSHATPAFQGEGAGEAAR